MRKVHPNGYTLPEILLVCAMIGIVAGFAIRTVDVMDMRLDAATRELGFTLLAAQNKAVLRQYDILVRIDTVAGLLEVIEDRNGDGVRGEDEPVVVWQVPEAMSFGRGPAPALHFGGAAATFRERNEAPELVFHRNGSASEWGGIYLRSHRAGQGHPDEVRAIEVDRGTGRVTWWRHTRRGWERS